MRRPSVLLAGTMGEGSCAVVRRMGALPQREPVSHCDTLAGCHAEQGEHWRSDCRSAQAGRFSLQKLKVHKCRDFTYCNDHPLTALQTVHLPVVLDNRGASSALGQGMTEPSEHDPGEYEMLNIFGSPTGIRINLMHGHPFPAAPRGYRWTRADRNTAEG
jgi:hypothetical protein